MPADGKGAKGGDVMTRTHATGAAATYGMRYLLKMIFNVAIGEDDNDGNGVSNFITEEQAAGIKRQIEELNIDTKQFLKAVCPTANSVDELPALCYQGAVSMIKMRKSAK